MSVSFEATVVLQSDADISGHEMSELRGERICVGRLLALLPKTTREHLGAARSLAKELSQSGCKAAAIYYDDRTGTRSAELFNDGELISEFGAESEKWVVLGENGLPDLAAPTRSATELAPEAEAECIVTAIDLALISLGAEQREARELLGAIMAA